MQFAYIGTKRNKREKKYEYCLFDEREQNNLQKKRTLYITIQSKKRKAGKIGTKKGATKQPLNNPANGTLTTKALRAYWLIP